jgi:hypothetical protein
MEKAIWFCNKKLNSTWNVVVSFREIPVYWHVSSNFNWNANAPPESRHSRGQKLIALENQSRCWHLIFYCFQNHTTKLCTEFVKSFFIQELTTKCCNSPETLDLHF